MPTRRWVIHTENLGGPQSNWFLSPWDTPGWVSVGTINTGETVVRTRVQGTFTFALHDSDPTATANGSFSPGATAIQVGVWVDKNGGGGGTPVRLPILGGRDERWVWLNQMQHTDLSEFHTGLNEDNWTATYSINSGDVDSQAERGPMAADTDIWLALGYSNPVFDPMVNGGFPLFTFFSYALTVNCLIQAP